MIRRLIACIAIAIVATACFGAAASLAVTADRVAASSADPTLNCAGPQDSPAVVSYSYSGSKVATVGVSNLPIGCQGGELWLTLLDGTSPSAQVVSQVDAHAFTGSSTSVNVPDVEASLVKKYAIAVVT